MAEMHVVQYVEPFGSLYQRRGDHLFFTFAIGSPLATDELFNEILELLARRMAMLPVNGDLEIASWAMPDPSRLTNA